MKFKINLLSGTYEDQGELSIYLESIINEITNPDNNLQMSVFAFS